jgi:hypothetical protein
MASLNYIDYAAGIIGFLNNPGVATISIGTSGSIKSTSASSGVGYATGAGGTVTQATSKTTGVTLNTLSGQITMNNAALAANTTVSFTFTNSAIAATDTLMVSVASSASVGYRVAASGYGTGSARIEVQNTTAGSLSEAVVLNFTILKGVNS